jgi:hypothetical protein
MTENTPNVDLPLVGKSVEDLSDLWLMQALSQLVQSFGATAEGRLATLFHGKRQEEYGIAHFVMRLNGSRMTVILSAFAAEAYINRFLHNRLVGGDLKTATAIRPPAEKFTVGTQLALGATLFPRDEPTYERLKQLFTLRNRLAHARPRPVEQEEVLGERAYEDFNPLAAHGHLETVAQAAHVLLGAQEPPASVLVVEQVLEGLPALRRIAERMAAIPVPTRDELSAEIAEARAAHPRYFLNAHDTR